MVLLGDICFPYKGAPQHIKSIKTQKKKKGRQVYALHTVQRSTGHTSLTGTHQNKNKASVSFDIN